VTTIGRTTGMRRADLVQRATQDPRRYPRTEEVAQAVLASLRADRAGDGEARASGPALPRNLLGLALRYIHENLDTKLKWDEIAAAVGLDPFRFGRGFKRAMGVTPHQYVIECRVRLAMELLSGGRSGIADIALEVGCSCQSHLTTVFRRHTGTTPAAYRRAALESRRVLEAAAARSRSEGSLPRKHPAVSGVPAS
jgi:transcriptional regulator GlxA family with amidase domain